MARISYNAGEEEVTDSFTPLPPGAYDLKIVEAEMTTSKNGDPQAIVNFVVVNGLAHEGKSVKFHRVTFISDDRPGAGIAKAFLKSIGQPYKGQIDVDTDAWVGKVLAADISIDEYNGKKYNKVNYIRASNVKTIQEETEELPF